MNIYPRDLSGVVILTLLSLSATSATLAQSTAPIRNEISLDGLKSTYLACERTALSGRMESGAIMVCSAIYEELKHRAFDGDFPRLKAWADQHLRQKSN
jgi:hypothetical protein